MDRVTLAAAEQQKFAPPSFSCITFSTTFEERFDLPQDMIRTTAASPAPVPLCGVPFVTPAGIAVTGRAPRGTVWVDVDLDAAAHVDAVRLAQSSGNAGGRPGRAGSGTRVRLQSSSHSPAARRARRPTGSS